MQQNLFYKSTATYINKPASRLSNLFCFTIFLILATLSCLLELENFYQKWHSQMNLSIGPIRYSPKRKMLIIKELNSSRHTIHVLPNKTLMPNSKAFGKAGI